jgi:hypothetical protein
MYLVCHDELSVKDMSFPFFKHCFRLYYLPTGMATSHSFLSVFKGAFLSVVSAPIVLVGDKIC